MTLRDHFEHSGEWLFRHRSYLPIVLCLLPVAAIWTNPVLAHRALSPGWCAVAIAVSAAGLCVRAWTVGSAPVGTSGRNTHGQVAESLNTSGAYSLMRHPLYLGNYLMWLGLALVPGSWEVAVIVSLLFWLYYERIMSAEEAFLTERFGARFLDWAARTPAFLPALMRLREQWRPPELSFSVRSVLRREYSGLSSLLLTFALLQAVAMARVTGRVKVPFAWVLVLLVVFGLHVVLRTMKRRTGLLAVPGR